MPDDFESTSTSYESQDPPKEDEAETTRKQELITLAMKRFAQVSTAESKQRAREVEDLRFDRGLLEDHWPDDIRALRMGQLGSPPRPCLVINKLDVPVQQVIAEARQSRLAIEIKPKGDGADDSGATLRQGMIRAIEVDSNAEQARQWALERAAKCGRGYYRVLKGWANDLDNDQDLLVKRIKHQGSVYFDPFAEEMDNSDATWCMITTDLSKEEYQLRWPDSDLASASTFESTGDTPAGWIGDDGYRVAEYFYVEKTFRERIVSPQGKWWVDEQHPKMLEYVGQHPEARVRKVPIIDVKWAVINAHEVLEEEDWDGRFIPVVTVIGKEYSVDGSEVVYKGIISNAKDAQRSYNYMRSAQVEAVGLAPKSPFLVAEGQLEGYKDQWSKANHLNYPYLTYKPTSFEGQLVGPPRRDTSEPPIQAITAAVREADEDIKSTTGRHDPSLGANPRDQSGKAIERLQEQASTGSSTYIDNLARISMRYEAMILLDLLPKVYDRPGRIARLLGEEDKERQVILGQPFTQGQDGAPQPLPPEGVSMMAGANGSEPPEVKQYDLTKGTYSVVVSVGPSMKTQRDENSQLIQSFIEAVPDMVPWVADILMEQLGGPLAERLSKRLRKANPQLADEGDDAEPQIPPELQQQMEELQQQGQQLQQENEKLTQQVAVNGEKAQATLQAKQLEMQGRIQIATMEIASAEKIAMARMQTDLQRSQVAGDTDITEATIQASGRINQSEINAAAKSASESEKRLTEGEKIRTDAAIKVATAKRAESQPNV